ncbi:protein EARLY-RESPONSIVE TO DEHYDRATION 7, chloroplastic-like [Abrus precatorius]|uniref:Protein EARLY-RESPONSIVE TO DEHYDRATION 7, chloroplastic-like n=1 Tax=Abrus precatorius TaxID=3816 RepID=A0A8B8LHU7_ABRPR|nr:protein EARLY-RESPONSIVE TO DEHYDRATION 7, chloroplastic-like [Abrus precatorius]
MSQHSSFYPRVDFTNPEANSPFSQSSSSSSSMYPSIDTNNVAVAEEDSNTTQPMEHVLVTVPGAILHLIEKDSSVHLASGDLTIASLREGEKVVAVLARIGDQIQWPLAKDVSAVKLDESHYFFTLKVPQKHGENELEVLNYGLTVAAKGQEGVLKELDEVLEKYSFVSEERVEGVRGWEVLDGSVSKETSPEELKSEKKREVVEERSAAYWTTLAPNVEDYSGNFARWIASGSGQVVRGILWCGDVTVDRLKWGNDFLKKRLQPGSQSHISPQALERMKRVKKLTKMSEKVATGVLSGVVKVSGFFTSSVVNSKAGKKFFSLLPGEIVLATMDGFNKVCDAAEVAGRNVMSTSSVVTTGLVSHKYGEQAAQVTNEGLDAAGHAIGTAWAVFKLRKALNPKSVIKPTTLAKAAGEVNSAKLKAKK